MFLTAILDFAEKNDVHPSRFLIYCSGDLSRNKSEGTASVAFCGGISHNLA